MRRGLTLLLLAAACAGGSGETKRDWRADWGKPCFSREDCGGGLDCQNPGDPVTGGAEVDTRTPACEAQQIYCEGGCVAPCTADSCPAGTRCGAYGCCERPPPPPESCDPGACGARGGRCVNSRCELQGVCEPPPA